MLEERLRELIRQDARLMSILQAAREVDLPNWYIGAGVIRNTVWDYLHGHPGRTPLRDIDLAYFDSNDLSDRLGKEAEEILSKAVPDVEWDVVNQAGVHFWYKDSFGHAVDPLNSCEEGIDTWPETATCVAVKLLEDDTLHIYAPFGLEDLFNMVLRRNATRITPEIFKERYIKKRIKERWPLVTIIEEEVDVMVEQVIVREFRVDDHAQVLKVWERSGLEPRTSDSLEELQKLLERDPELFLVAECNEQIVGAVLGAYDGRRGWVYHLGVDPEFQRRGIGNKLMEELLGKYRAKGVNKVNLMVTADNMGACEYYKKLGFILHDYVVMGIPLQGKY